MDINWDINVDSVLSVIAALVAIFALFQTSQQIRTSNKQHLFDKRVEAYLIALVLIESYRSHRSILKRLLHDEKLNSVDIEFYFFTDNDFLADIMLAIKLQTDRDQRNNFISKIGVIRDVGVKFRFLFTGNEANILSAFVLCYKELLYRLYKYEECIYPIYNTDNTFGKSLEELLEQSNEKRHRDLLRKSIEDIKLAFDELERNNIEQIINDQIKL